MAEIHVKKFSAGYPALVEDPVLTNNRLFITTQGHDTTTLAPLFQKNWCWNYNDSFYTTYADDNTAGTLVLEKGVVQCWSNSEAGDVIYNNDMHGDWHLGLDRNYFPVKRFWKTINGRVLFANHYGSPPASSGLGGGSCYNLLYSSTDITAGSGASSFASTANPISHYIYEDVSNQRIWGFHYGGANGDYVYYNNQYETVTGTGGQVSGPASRGKSMFLGVDDLGFLHFVSVEDYSSLNSTHYFWKIHPTTFATTTIISSSNRANTTSYGMKTYPSNIRRASSTRRVMYTGHFDASNILAPIRYVWNPADGSVTATNCTMTYQSSNTYSTYAAKYTTESVTTYNYYSWKMQPQQFTVNGVNYITFWLVDKMAYTGNGLSRWSTSQKRTMMTYTIGSGTGDDVLTYHSSYTFPTVNDIPREWMPINSSGTQVMVPVTLQMKFFSFNETTGWAPTGTYPYEFRAVGLDQTNRIWGVSREKAQAVLHMITPTIPVTINVVMAASSFTFTGSNISTSCTVDAYGSDGTRIATSVNLAIDGNTMLFTTNSTKNLTVTTSASASTVVNLTITGGGVNNIIASVDI
jgi:hypothetical protein